MSDRGIGDNTVVLNQVPPSLVVEVYSLTPVGPQGPPGPPGPPGPQGPGIGDAPADNVMYGRFNLNWSPAVPLSGGTMTGPLMLARDPVSPMEAATRQYVDTVLRMVDAPTDGLHYARTVSTWDSVLSTDGGTMAGPIDLDDSQIVDGGQIP